MGWRINPILTNSGIDPYVYIMPEKKNEIVPIDRITSQVEWNIVGLHSFGTYSHQSMLAALKLTRPWFICHCIHSISMAGARQSDLIWCSVGSPWIIICCCVAGYVYGYVSTFENVRNLGVSDYITEKGILWAYGLRILCECLCNFKVKQYYS